MEKVVVVRYDLDRVYYLNEYYKAADHAEQNIGIHGIKEQLERLNAEKSSYTQEVSALAEAERDNERHKYEAYQKWADIFKVCRWIFFGGLIGTVLRIFIGKYLSYTLASIVAFLLVVALFVGGPATIFSFLRRVWYARQYQQYVDGISSRFESMGRSFEQISRDYYRAIDTLYLNSLDPTHRELVLLRRDQAEQSQKLINAEKEQHRLQRELIGEQQRSRAVQQELLNIERERERRYRENSRGW